MNQYNILLVDDDVLVLKVLCMVLEEKGYLVETASSGEKALELLAKKHFDLVITDLIMYEIDGIKVLKKAKEISSDTMVIILTGYGDMNTAIEALRLRADDYILKPCEQEELYFRVSRLLEKVELKRKIKCYENILPVCMMCKKLRDDTGKKHGTGEWMTMEKYMLKKAGVTSSHTYCPECGKKAIEELEKIIPERKNSS